MVNSNYTERICSALRSIPTLIIPKKSKENSSVEEGEIITEKTRRNVADRAEAVSRNFSNSRQAGKLQPSTRKRVPIIMPTSKTTKPLIILTEDVSDTTCISKSTETGGLPNRIRDVADLTGFVQHPENDRNLIGHCGDSNKGLWKHPDTVLEQGMRLMRANSAHTSSTNSIQRINTNSRARSAGPWESTTKHGNEYRLSHSRSDTWYSSTPRNGNHVKLLPSGKTSNTASVGAELFSTHAPTRETILHTDADNRTTGRISSQKRRRLVPEVAKKWKQVGTCDLQEKNNEKKVITAWSKSTDPVAGLVEDQPLPTTSGVDPLEGLHGPTSKNAKQQYDSSKAYIKGVISISDDGASQLHAERPDSKYKRNSDSTTAAASVVAVDGRKPDDVAEIACAMHANGSHSLSSQKSAPSDTQTTRIDQTAAHTNGAINADLPSSSTARLVSNHSAAPRTAERTSFDGCGTKRNMDTENLTVQSRAIPACSDKILNNDMSAITPTTGEDDRIEKYTKNGVEVCSKDSMKQEATRRPRGCCDNLSAAILLTSEIVNKHRPEVFSISNPTSQFPHAVDGDTTSRFADEASPNKHTRSVESFGIPVIQPHILLDGSTALQSTMCIEENGMANSAFRDTMQMHLEAAEDTHPASSCTSETPGVVCTDKAVLLNPTASSYGTANQNASAVRRGSVERASTLLVQPLPMMPPTSLVKENSLRARGTRRNYTKSSQMKGSPPVCSGLCQDSKEAVLGQQELRRNQKRGPLSKHCEAELFDGFQSTRKDSSVMRHSRFDPGAPTDKLWSPNIEISQSKGPPIATSFASTMANSTFEKPSISEQVRPERHDLYEVEENSMLPSPHTDCDELFSLAEQAAQLDGTELAFVKTKKVIKAIPAGKDTKRRTVSPCVPGKRGSSRLYAKPWVRKPDTRVNTGEPYQRVEIPDNFEVLLARVFAESGEASVVVPTNNEIISSQNNDFCVEEEVSLSEPHAILLQWCEQRNPSLTVDGLCLLAKRINISPRRFDHSTARWKRKEVNRRLFHTIQSHEYIHDEITHPTPKNDQLKDLLLQYLGLIDAKLRKHMPAIIIAQPSSVETIQQNHKIYITQRESSLAARGPIPRTFTGLYEVNRAMFTVTPAIISNHLLVHRSLLNTLRAS